MAISLDDACFDEHEERPTKSIPDIVSALDDETVHPSLAFPQNCRGIRPCLSVAPASG
jgi:hypothetical protein